MKLSRVNFFSILEISGGGVEFVVGILLADGHGEGNSLGD